MLSSLHRSLVLLGLLVPGLAAASPIGTAYTAELSTLVQDSVGNERRETHFDLDLAFDGAPERFSSSLIFAPPPGSTFLDPNEAWIDETASASSGAEVLEFWIFGDDDGDLTPPGPGSFGPLFVNPLTSGPNFLSFLVQRIYWPGELASEIVGAEFSVLARGSDDPIPLLPEFFIPGGSGTEDDPFELGWAFAPSDLPAALVAFHARIEIRHVPEPRRALAGAFAALAVLAVRRGPFGV